MPSPHPPVPIALIGCGNFARWQHLPNLHRLPGADLRLVCDADGERAGEAARRYGCEASTSAAAVLADPAIAAVVIAVRDEQQAELTMLALDHGKHVYVEKPVGTTPAEIARVTAVAARTQRHVVVGFQKRSAPAYRLARTVLAADGGVQSLSLRMTDDAWRWATGYAPGALLVHDVCHLFDAARWLCASDILSVYAVRARPDDDQLILRMTGGQVVSIVASGHGSMDMPKERLDAISMRGGVSVEDFAELHAYGYPGVAPVTRFAGVTHPDQSLLARYLLAEQGAAGLATIRRIAWQLGEEVRSGRAAQLPDGGEITRFVADTIPNFLRDQGWQTAMARFLAVVAGGPADPDLPGLADAMAASAAAAAALRSLTSGRPEAPIGGATSQSAAALS